ncbi:glycogen debranching protein GlgX [Neomegalonema sp.]|uniref:glycogen debranching protein GlgX n=1 Tax=Neomegalonema sp. TaxID=2039713 RepID=UPI0026194166|nr:glycogen debranching protein GlgX [Neomegalonema sp.]MDD2868719.1 glycogen debranching protein GlgX [Neomegalonema sp.]
MEPGEPTRLGAWADPEGVSFSLFAAAAERIELQLFDARGAEIWRGDLPERDGAVWHGRLPGAAPGMRYGYRAHGPWAPERGLRFNPAKLLLDPYARRLDGEIRWNDAVHGHVRGGPEADLRRDDRDSAPFVPRGVILAPEEERPAPGERPPLRPFAESVIYEAHLKGLTQLDPGVAPQVRGNFEALGDPRLIERLLRLGVTAVELLPVQSFLDDRFLVEKGLRNYWGYNSLGFFAPMERYLGPGGVPAAKAAIRALQAAGIEVILDVVYNHSAESDELGPTLSFRGLDNAAYYRLKPENPRFYLNDAGTGNTLNLAHPFVTRLVMDSLRLWVEVWGVDGFRFDLATTLARMPEGWSPDAPFLTALRQDPVLNRVRLIVEPWDVGWGGYQVGSYPVPFAEWNDQFRDETRRFWRGDVGAARLAPRLLGSADIYASRGRRPQAAVNFVTAHDGITLADLTRYGAKRNQANGEENRDGNGGEINLLIGPDGPTRDPELEARRRARARALLATLLLSQGVPMLLAGDEILRSQQGNNNAYPQDNALGWIDWSAEDQDPSMADFIARLTALRRETPALRQKRFLHGEPRARDGAPNVSWLRPDGAEPSPEDWNAPEFRAFGLILRAEEGPDAAILINGAAGPVAFAPLAGAWRREISTADPVPPDPWLLAPDSLTLLRLPESPAS